jgi:hypothetical protein
MATEKMNLGSFLTKQELEFLFLKEGAETASRSAACSMLMAFETKGSFDPFDFAALLFPTGAPLSIVASSVAIAARCAVVKKSPGTFSNWHRYADFAQTKKPRNMTPGRGCNSGGEESRPVACLVPCPAG